MPNPWTLLQSFPAAGSYSWTAPDKNSGEPYQVGYYVIGGGGSGGAALLRSRPCSPASLCASGGASGRTVSGTVTVTPGDSYTVVVGTGAAPAVIRPSRAIRYAGGTPGLAPSGTPADAVFSGTTVPNGEISLLLTLHLANGNAGEASSFRGITAPGGQGGIAALTAAPGAPGGQGSDAAAPDVIAARPVAPYSGRQTVSSRAADNAIGGTTFPLEASNPFVPYDNYLIAGGGASAVVALLQTALYAQYAGLATFGSGSPGTAVKDNTDTVRTVTGITPTAYGAGSGGVVLDGYSRASVQKAVVTGEGAPGAVFLYY